MLIWRASSLTSFDASATSRRTLDSCFMAPLKSSRSCAYSSGTASERRTVKSPWASLAMPSPTSWATRARSACMALLLAKRRFSSSAARLALAASSNRRASIETWRRTSKAWVMAPISSLRATVGSGVLVSPLDRSVMALVICWTGTTTRLPKPSNSRVKTANTAAEIKPTARKANSVTRDADASCFALKALDCSTTWSMMAR